MASSEDTEITLGTGKLLVLFFSLVGVCALFFALPHRFRWLLLLVSNYCFYMCWRPVYALLLVLITAIDFSVGISLARATHGTPTMAGLERKGASEILSPEGRKKFNRAGVT